MEVVEFGTFMERTMGGRPNQMDVTPYIGASYDCGCGQSHQFMPPMTAVMRELPRMRLVIGSSSCGYANCVKVRGLIRFKGFETLFSTKPDA